MVRSVGLVIAWIELFWRLLPVRQGASSTVPAAGMDRAVKWYPSRTAVGLQPTGAKPGPAFLKGFCGCHKPGEMQSGLDCGSILDSE
jgi:hypothetical protein